MNSIIMYCGSYSNCFPVTGYIEFWLHDVLNLLCISHNEKTVFLQVMESQRKTVLLSTTQTTKAIATMAPTWHFLR